MRPRGRTWRAARASAGACLAGAAMALAGCSGGGIGDVGALAGGPLAYQHASAISPAGYSETQIAPDRYRIQVQGPLATPRERMEKIAATRAAEIGKENNLGYFKIEGVEHGSHCKSFTAGSQNGGKETKRRQIQYAVLTADVSYAKQPPDASYIQARPAFDQYRAELDLPQPGGLPADAAPPPACS